MLPLYFPIYTDNPNAINTLEGAHNVAQILCVCLFVCLLKKLFRDVCVPSRIGVGWESVVLMVVEKGQGEVRAEKWFQQVK